MPKKAVFTTITPLPTGITRKSVVDMYHDHLAMIDLNPLVVERYACKPPSYAPTDEYYKTWYTIKDKVSYLPGGLATGSVSYHACFHDTDAGLQTHVYAPLGLDIQAKWSVGGRLAGEPLMPTEPGLNAPRHGLYIREDVHMTCSSLLMGFVKRTFKDSHAGLVAKLVERAHILESSFANQRLQALRNVDPGERMGHGDIFIAPPPEYLSPGPTSQIPSPRFLIHRRGSSDPVLSPGFSQSSTLTDQSNEPPSPLPTPKVETDRPISFRFILEEKPVSSSAPDSNSFLLPATTYDGGFSQRHERPVSLYPGSPSHQVFERTSHLPVSPRQRSATNPEFLQPPVLSYTPDERPISFQFAFDPQSPFDRRSEFSIKQSDRDNLLSDIDNAIDEVFNYTLPSPTPTPNPTPTSATLPSTAYKAETLLPATTYAPPPPTLTAAKYDPKAARHDSARPLTACEEEDEVPPVPLKDDKYRKLAEKNSQPRITLN